MRPLQLWFFGATPRAVTETGSRRQTRQRMRGQSGSAWVLNKTCLAGSFLLLGLHVGALAQAPAPDAFNPGANSTVYDLAVQADGKIVVGGRFTQLGGQARDYIARLNGDGTLDPVFNPGANSFVDTVAVEPDGAILVGGEFTNLDSQNCKYIGRLNTNGTLDTSFKAEADGSVFALAVQADGKIVVGGQFTALGGQSCTNIGRLNSDGTFDTNFNSAANDVVQALALQPDGKVLVGGYFTALDGQSCTNLGRLNDDGTLDTNFSPGPNRFVACLAVQPDGKVLVGGYFTRLSGQPCNYVGRLNGDGTLQTNFGSGANSLVACLAVQADGNILVSGGFTTLAGHSRNYIGRLNADGTLDSGFNPGAGGTFPFVYALALQPEGTVLVGGNFTALGGQGRTNLARLYNTGPATQNLSFDGSTLTWTRGGTSPEVWRTTFECAPDGTSWTNLGVGIRIPGGWQLAGLSLPTNTTLRARGYAVGGIGDTSGWFVETVLRQPLSISEISFANGEFGFDAWGPAGQLVVIEASPDLKTWTPLETNTVGTGPLPFRDPQVPLLSRRFYRLHAEP